MDRHGFVWPDLAQGGDSHDLDAIDRSRNPLARGRKRHHSRWGIAMTAPPSERILRLNTVLDRTGLSRATLYRKVRAGTFPKQISIATSSTGWRESAINDWLRNPMFWSIDDGSARQS